MRRDAADGGDLNMGIRRRARCAARLNTHTSISSGGYTLNAHMNVGAASACVFSKCPQLEGGGDAAMVAEGERERRRAAERRVRDSHL